MTLKDLAAELARSEQISVSEARRQIDAVLDLIVDAAAARGGVSLARFGAFRVVDRAARKQRNPRTGETMILPPARRIGFTPAKSFKMRVQRS